jgi:signal transduction histidine kinase
LITAAAIKDIKLETEVAEDTIVMADSNMLSTILRNLCTNAVKFTNQGGVIKIIGEKQGDEVLISVVDNGIGMNDETQARLFKIGTNISTNGTANEKGTGLGLILCKEFVERHGSRIKIESEPGKGSKFMFKLKIFDSI